MLPAKVQKTSLLSTKFKITLIEIATLLIVSLNRMLRKDGVFHLLLLFIFFFLLKYNDNEQYTEPFILQRKNEYFLAWTIQPGYLSKV